MQTAFLRRTRPLLVQTLVWLLVVALPVQGMAVTLTQLFGAVHRHAALPADDAGSTPGRMPTDLPGAAPDRDTAPALPVAASDGPSLATRLAAPLATPLPSVDQAPHAHGPGGHLHTHAGEHAHSMFERHYHGVDDLSVQALGSHPGQDPDSAGTSPCEIGSFPIPVGRELVPVAPAPVCGARWAAAPEPLWFDHTPAPADKPPRSPLHANRSVKPAA